LTFQEITTQGVGVGVVTPSLTWQVPDTLRGEIGAIVSFGEEHAKSLTAGHASALREGARVLAARPRAFGAEFWGAAIARGLSVCRVDSRVGFAVEIALVIETRKLVAAMGRTALAGVPVVAGGVIGPRGIGCLVAATSAAQAMAAGLLTSAKAAAPKATGPSCAFARRCTSSLSAPGTRGTNR
jgi:hypothetical protein